MNTHRRPGHAARPDYIAELDGLRTVAVGLVLWYHVPRGLISDDSEAFLNAFHPGPRGVMLFFVLSGFLITRLLLEARRAGEPLGAFYVRRVARIFPSYYLLLAVCAVLDPHPRLVPCALYWANFHQINGGDLSYLSHTWSLAVEEHFYLVWPLLLVVFPARIVGRCALVCLAAIFVASTACYLDRFPSDVPRLRHALYHSSGTEVLGLGLGASLAFCERFLRGKLALALVAPLVLGALWVLCTLPVLAWTGLAHALIRTGVTAPDNWVPFFELVRIALSSAAIVALVIALAGRRRSPLAWLALPPLVHLGKLSYGLYLYHMPLMALLGWQALSEDGPRAIRMALAYYPLVYAVAWLSYRFYERPLTRRGRALSERWFPRRP